MTRFDTLLVEIEFTTDVWTDVTGYVNLEENTLEFSRGRTNQYEQPSTGSLSLVLDNTDGRFTPFSALLTTGAANPYYPNVQENRRIRISAEHASSLSFDGTSLYDAGGVLYDDSVYYDEGGGSGSYSLWFGYIDSWTAVFPGGESKWSKVTVAASDRFKLLARRQLQSVYEEVARYAGADAYYPLAVSNETSGGVVTDKIRYAGTGTIVPPAFNTGAVWAWDNDAKPQQMDGALSFTGAVSAAVGLGAGVVSIPPLFTGVAASTLTIGVWFKTSHASSSTNAILFDSRFGTLLIHTATTGYLEGDMRGALSVSSSAAVNDGEWHHAMFVYTVTDVSWTGALYLDGDQVDNDVVGASLPYEEFPRWTLNGFLVSSGITPNAPGKASGSADVAYAGLILADADLGMYAADLYNAGHNNITGDEANDRAARILGWSGLHASEYDLAVDTTAVIGAQDGNQSALEALQQVAQAEYAPVFMSGDGLVTLESKAKRATFSPVAVFDADLDMDGPTAQFTLADEGIVNVVYGQITGGASATAIVADVLVDAYIDTYSASILAPLVDTVDAPWSSIDQARDAAYHRLIERYQAKPRMGQLVLDPLTSSTDIWASVFALEIGDLVRVTGLNAPTAPGGVTQVDLFVESLNWSISMQSVTLTIDTTGVDRSFGQVEFDDADTGWFATEPGVCTVGTASALAGTGTGTFTIATPTGSLWSTDVADFPKTLNVGLEEFTVTGITGAASPQTATVSVRGVNGTAAAAHAAGDTVQLAPTPVFAH